MPFRIEQEKCGDEEILITIKEKKEEMVMHKKMTHDKFYWD